MKKSLKQIALCIALGACAGLAAWLSVEIWQATEDPGIDEHEGG